MHISALVAPAAAANAPAAAVNALAHTGAMYGTYGAFKHRVRISD
jgi:hypothetical protein